MYSKGTSSFCLGARRVDRRYLIAQAVEEKLFCSFLRPGFRQGGLGTLFSGIVVGYPSCERSRFVVEFQKLTLIKLFQYFSLITVNHPIQISPYPDFPTPLASASTCSALIQPWRRRFLRGRQSSCLGAFVASPQSRRLRAGCHACRCPARRSRDSICSTCSWPHSRYTRLRSVISSPSRGEGVRLSAISQACSS